MTQHTQTQSPGGSCDRWLSQHSLPPGTSGMLTTSPGVPSTPLFLPQATLGLPSQPPSLLGKEAWDPASVFSMLL